MATTDNPKKFKTIHAVYLLIAVVVIAAIVGVVYVTKSSGAAGPVVVAGDNISVYYTGTFTNGTVFDTNVGKDPLNFTVGAGQLIKGFDEGVIGMKLNQTKTMTLAPDVAYGEVNQSLIISISRKEFGNMTLTDGEAISSSQGQEAKIVSFNATNVTVNFNPPLAGQTLVFKVTVVSIKK